MNVRKTTLFLLLMIVLNASLMAKTTTIFIDGKPKALDTQVVEGKTYAKLTELAKMTGFNIKTENGALEISKGSTYVGFGQAFDEQMRPIGLSAEGCTQFYSTKVINGTNYMAIRDFVDLFWLTMTVSNGSIYIDTERAPYKVFCDPNNIDTNKSISGLGKVELVVEDMWNYIIDGDSIYYNSEKYFPFDEGGEGYLMRCDLDGLNKQIIVKEPTSSFDTNENTGYLIYSYKPRDFSDSYANFNQIRSHIGIYDKKTKETEHVAEGKYTGTMETGVGVRLDGTLYCVYSEWYTQFSEAYRITPNLQMVEDKSMLNSENDKKQDTVNRYIKIDEENNKIYFNHNGQYQWILKDVTAEDNPCKNRFMYPEINDDYLYFAVPKEVYSNRGLIYQANLYRIKIPNGWIK